MNRHRPGGRKKGRAVTAVEIGTAERTFGLDVARRLRAEAAEIEQDLGPVPRRYCFRPGAVWATAAGAVGLLSWLGLLLTN